MRVLYLRCFLFGLVWYSIGFVGFYTGDTLAYTEKIV